MKDCSVFTEGFSREMDLRQRLLEIDQLLSAPHLFLNTAAQGRILDKQVATIESVIADITRARERLRDLADEPTGN